MNAAPVTCARADAAARVEELLVSVRAETDQARRDVEERLSRVERAAAVLVVSFEARDDRRRS